MKKAKSGDKTSRPVGRPRLIDSPETFDRLVNEYVERCQNVDKPQPITLTGMILALGLTSKEGFYEYGTYDGFSDSLKRARLIVEQEYENRLILGTNAAAPIFALKNFGWMDKHPTVLDELAAEKLRRELQVDAEDAQPVTVNINVKDFSKSAD